MSLIFQVPAKSLDLIEFSANVRNILDTKLTFPIFDGLS